MTSLEGAQDQVARVAWPMLKMNALRAQFLRFTVTDIQPWPVGCWGRGGSFVASWQEVIKSQAALLVALGVLYGAVIGIVTYFFSLHTWIERAEVAHAKATVAFEWAAENHTDLCELERTQCFRNIDADVDAKRIQPEAIGDRIDACLSQFDSCNAERIEREREANSPNTP